MVSILKNALATLLVTATTLGAWSVAHEEETPPASISSLPQTRAQQRAQIEQIFAKTKDIWQQRQILLEKDFTEEVLQKRLKTEDDRIISFFTIISLQTESSPHFTMADLNKWVKKYLVSDPDPTQLGFGGLAMQIILQATKSRWGLWYNRSRLPLWLDASKRTFDMWQFLESEEHRHQARFTNETKNSCPDYNPRHQKKDSLFNKLQTVRSLQASLKTNLLGLPRQGRFKKYIKGQTILKCIQDYDRAREALDQPKSIVHESVV